MQSLWAFRAFMDSFLVEGSDEEVVGGGEGGQTKSKESVCAHLRKERVCVYLRKERVCVYLKRKSLCLLEKKEFVFTSKGVRSQACVLQLTFVALISDARVKSTKG